MTIDQRIGEVLFVDIPEDLVLPKGSAVAYVEEGEDRVVAIGLVEYVSFTDLHLKEPKIHYKTTVSNLVNTRDLRLKVTEPWLQELRERGPYSDVYDLRKVHSPDNDRLFEFLIPIPTATWGEEIEVGDKGYVSGILFGGKAGDTTVLQFHIPSGLKSLASLFDKTVHIPLPHAQWMVKLVGEGGEDA